MTHGFFERLIGFVTHVGDECLLLPHRVEFVREPNDVDRFFIDGPMDEI